ncbi:hypothetical protein [Lacimicrobium alkaliphilum]|uniref:Uncharacterized protein n=1 Tax=Lacimicrobium alkaliphilum TaxID=1526571 RepID=A0ABQ1RMP8_9ALTE|nr:hypothetical protein [Lacimicrobium alkaliphilum]GGD73086.1 hypothetical protein GCM10011357_30210 [Lacimicrobium alkaliphilum]
MQQVIQKSWGAWADDVNPKQIWTVLNPFLDKTVIFARIICRPILRLTEIEVPMALSKEAIE